ncbi:transcription initiation factor TFIID subunit 1 [Caerostris extrusa]|uniref:Transcription initiation factor TFIID subunit 1 n=1 Tax=Caerostris extrusa TaxID=172846 RepID=A0AAV4PE23_CAEEX|nr:transcription initiation factor TFIID subunit 1 [Caerostris extrusa]
MDSDEDGDNDRVMSLTHVLFGNIDDDGQLENDFLEPESVPHLDQLRQLGIGTQLKEIITDDVDSNDFDQKEYNGSDEFIGKSPSAVDYYDITEFVDEAEEMNADGSATSSESSRFYNSFRIKEEECDEETIDVKPNDADLMPPPSSLPPSKDAENLSDDWNSANASYESKSIQQEIDVNLKAVKVENAEKKLDTPLAAMLPSKYKNMDVTKLFPEFRHGQVLRKKKKKKSCEDTGNIFKIAKNLKLDISTSPPPPEECESDEEAKMVKLEEKNRLGTTNESYDANEQSLNYAAWRYGPSQLWYDMLNVNETGEGFDYGFKLKEPSDTECNEDNESKNLAEIDEYPNDAYFMVTQYPWEDDIIWNGEEVKHKVRIYFSSLA